jgi:Ca2+-dependent lipid-binding protein
MSQGTVLTWVEINELNVKKEDVPVYDISKKPEEDFEVRVIIWDTEELKIMDSEGTTDGFVRVFFDSGSSKDTDTHFRNTDGKCSWNYRLLFPFRYPSTKYELTVQAYDLDLFKSNDFIGQKVINLKELISDSDLAKRPISLT